MGGYLRRRGLTLAIAVGTIVATTCGGDDSTSPTGPDPLAAALTAEATGVAVNGDELAKGESRQVELDEQIVLGEGARGLLRLAEVGFELFKMTDMKIVSSDRLEVGSRLESGHVHVTLDDDADARVQLETPTGVVLTTLQPGTELTVCQSPDGVTCLHVEAGAVEWEAQGESKIYPAGQSAFGLEGDPPLPPKCVPDESFVVWFQTARRNETSPALGDVVNDSPPCDDVPTTDPARTEPPTNTSGPPSSTSPSEVVTVPGAEAWTNTGFDVRSGDQVEIEAGGAITHADGGALVDPDGDPDPGLRSFNVAGLEDVNHGAMIGRVGNAGTPFFVGTRYRITIQEKGRLFLGINDGGVDNNSGEFVATVTVTRS